MVFWRTLFKTIEGGWSSRSNKRGDDLEIIRPQYVSISSHLCPSSIYLVLTPAICPHLVFFSYFRYFYLGWASPLVHQTPKHRVPTRLNNNIGIITIFSKHAPKRDESMMEKNLVWLVKKHWDM